MASNKTAPRESRSKDPPYKRGTDSMNPNRQKNRNFRQEKEAGLFPRGTCKQSLGVYASLDRIPYVQVRVAAGSRRGKIDPDVA